MKHGLLTGARAGDVASGAIFIAFGVTFAAGSLTYDLGSLVEPGPGLFPFGIALVLVALGLLILGKPALAILAERRAASAERLTNDSDPGARRPTLTAQLVWDTARPFVLIFGAILFFAFGIEPLGFLVTTLITSTLAALGWKGSSAVKVLITATVLTAVSYVIFVVLLRLRVDLLPFGW